LPCAVRCRPCSSVRRADAASAAPAAAVTTRRPQFSAPVLCAPAMSRMRSPPPTSTATASRTWRRPTPGAQRLGPARQRRRKLRAAVALPHLGVALRRGRRRPQRGRRARHRDGRRGRRPRGILNDGGWRAPSRPDARPPRHRGRRRRCQRRRHGGRRRRHRGQTRLRVLLGIGRGRLAPRAATRATATAPTTSSSATSTATAAWTPSSCRRARSSPSGSATATGRSGPERATHADDEEENMLDVTLADLNHDGRLDASTASLLRRRRRLPRPGRWHVRAAQELLHHRQDRLGDGRGLRRRRQPGPRRSRATTTSRSCGWAAATGRSARRATWSGCSPTTG
jgi:hypothetical protein